MLFSFYHLVFLFKYLKFSFDAQLWPFIMLNLNSFQMREVIYSRDQRVNRHKFDGVDPIVLYPFIIGSDLSLGSILGSLFSFQCNTLYLHLYWVGRKKQKFLAWGCMSWLKAKYFLVYLPHPNLGNKHFIILLLLFPFPFFGFFLFSYRSVHWALWSSFWDILFYCFSFKVII